MHKNVHAEKNSPMYTCMKKLIHQLFFGTEKENIHIYKYTYKTYTYIHKNIHVEQSIPIYIKIYI